MKTEDIVRYKHDWVKSELSDPKFRAKTVKLKTDYKREKPAKIKNQLNHYYEDIL